MTIRAADRRDSAAIAGLRAEVDAPASATEVEQRLASSDTRDPVFVATDGDRVVGVCAIHIGSQLHRAKPVARVVAIVVAESERRRGWGRRLLDHAVALARECGCGMIELTSRRHRDSSHEFYDAAGFERTSIRFSKDL